MITMGSFLEAAENSIQEIPGFTFAGRVDEISGVMLTASIRHVKIGEICKIEMEGKSLEAEVIGFKDDQCLLMPYGTVHGMKPDARVMPSGHALSVGCGTHLLGSVLDGLGRPLMPSLLRTGFIDSYEMLDVHRPAPNPVSRKRIKEVLLTGIQIVDTLLTIGKGQRIGIFAGAGTGKSNLLGQIAKSSLADVIIINLIGERGREVMDFIELNLGTEGLAKSVVVAATSDQPAIVRLKSAYVATTIAEYFRDQGKDVCLLMDSVTRFARSLREIGLARGEPPTRAGYPPSVYAELPRLMERTGTNDKGSITAFYTVLVEGDDLTDPVADEVMSILDGHIILSRRLANENRYPAIDILKSKSRLMRSLASNEHQEIAEWIIEKLALVAASEDAIRFGFYETGKNEALDLAVNVHQVLIPFLYSKPFAYSTLQEIIASLKNTVTGS